MKVNSAKIIGKTKKERYVILAGDIGGTKTTLGCFVLEGRVFSSQRICSYQSSAYADFKSILKIFLKDHQGSLDAACFGIAGPVSHGICQTTNLPWVVKSASLKPILKTKAVALINDMEATAYGIQALPKTSFAVLNPGHAEPHENIALIAAGTGLGEAMLLWDGHRYRAVASEGGHADFAPCNPLELELCRYLLNKFGHSSYERVLSGPGIVNIYDFLKKRKFAKEPAWLKKELSQADPGTVITQNALDGRNALCAKALDLFCAAYAAESGNLALKFLARGGVYLGGGIAPKIIPKLKEDLFKKTFVDKGRFSNFLTQIPVHVIMEEKTALYGAAMYALQFLIE